MKASLVRLDLGAALAVALRLSGWLAVNLLCSMGVLAVAAFAIGSFTLGGMMLQMNNLASRFVAADLGRQHQFGQILICAFAISFFFVALFRRSSALAALRSEKEV